MNLIILSAWQITDGIKTIIDSVGGRLSSILAIFTFGTLLFRLIYPKAGERTFRDKNWRVRVFNIILLILFAVASVTTYNFYMQASAKYLVLPIDSMEDTCYGTPHNVDYVKGKDGKCILLRRDKEGSINYPLTSEGTLEFSVNVASGYRIHNHKPDIDSNKACLYTTVGYDSWYPGAMVIYGFNNGDIEFLTSTGYRKNNGEMQKLTAPKSHFRFHEWHTVGFSFGSQGQHIYLDGKVLTSQKNYTQPLAVGGDTIKPCDQATFGYFRSCFNENDTVEHWDIGFEGLIDNVKISREQLDW